LPGDRKIKIKDVAKEEEPCTWRIVDINTELEFERQRNVVFADAFKSVTALTMAGCCNFITSSQALQKLGTYERHDSKGIFDVIPGLSTTVELLQRLGS